jgi:hypothetical protein
VALVRTDVSEELTASIILRHSISSQRASVASIANVVPSSPNLVTLLMKALLSPWRNFPEDCILHSHRHGNLKSYNYIYLVLKIKFQF